MTDLDDIIEGHIEWPTKERIRGKCLCGIETELMLTHRMTRYSDNKMNAPFYACESCSQDYTQMMKDQWANYYSMIL